MPRNTLKKLGNTPPGNYLSSLFANRAFGQTNEDILWNLQCKVISELAEKGPCVIVGRCADYILRDKADCLKVFIHADMSFRAERIVKDGCKGVMIQESELISTVTSILEKELSVALGMSLPLFQLEAKQKQEKDKLRAKMTVKRQEIEKKQRLIRGLYENFVQGILTSEEYFDMKADYETAISALSSEMEQLEKGMDALDCQLSKYQEMEQDAKALAQDHVLTAELIGRLIDRIGIDHERNIHVKFRFKSTFQEKEAAPCSTM